MFTDEQKNKYKYMYDGFVKMLEAFDRNRISQMGDDEMEDYLFGEEFAGQLYCWFAPEQVSILEQAGFINQRVAAEASMIYLLLEDIDTTYCDFRAPQTVRNNVGPWQVMFTYANKILQELKK